MLHICLVALLLSLSASAADRASLFYWKGKIAPGLAVEIIGVNGDVRAEYSDGSEVEIMANMPDESEPSNVNVTLVEHESGVTACAVFPQGSYASACSREVSVSGTNTSGDMRVNFTVRIPRGVNLVGRTVNGQVEAKHLRSDVKVNTVNGRISISTSRSAEAHTVNGSITAALSSPARCSKSVFTTVNGSITLALPKTADTVLHAQTVNGSVRSDLPAIGARRKSAKLLQARLGNGSASLKANTVNGHIVLRRSSEI
ncbi:MAG TPA: DUF4097 family beta strand repeat-containing protein [Bryobacteraceae bacterium]|jgi:hypothetical protein|nr:DUF4097 family beta strand repeat-containing protein [Bryobacteraceae bacterium]